jgi:hypothetical protein
MCTENIVVLVIATLILGPPAAIWPYKLARWSEILDAIGRKPSGRVEPADWKVILTRVFGIGVSIVGIGFLLFCVLLTVVT